MSHLTRWAEIFPEEQSPLRIRQSFYPVLNSSPHNHDFTELAIILGGSGCHLVDDETYEFGVGDVFVLQGHHAHCFREVRELSILEILLHPHSLALPYNELRLLPGYHALFVLEPQCRQQHRFQSRLHLAESELTHLDTLVTPMLREFAERRPGYEAALLAGYLQLVVYLARCYSQTTHPSSRYLLRIAEAISRLDRQYQEAISLDDLAATAHLSVNQFLRIFKRVTQQTPIEYLLQVRLRMATELLATTDLAVTEVALRVGFTDSNYFSRQFKRKYGISPREFRAMESSRVLRTSYLLREN